MKRAWSPFWIFQSHQGLILLTGLTVVSILMSSLCWIELEIAKQFRAQLRTTGANAIITSREKGASSISSLNLEQWRELQAWLDGQSLKWMPVLYKVVKLNGAPAVAAGVDFRRVGDFFSYWDLVGAVPSQSGEILVGKTLADQQKLQMGAGAALHGGDNMTVAGIYETGSQEDSVFMLDLARLQQMTGAEAPSHVFLSVPGGLPQITEMQRHFPATGGLELSPVHAIAETENAVFKKISALVFSSSFCIVLISLLTLATTVKALFLERSTEFALRRALGAGRRTIMRQISEEFLTVLALSSFSGVLFGALLSYFVAAQLLGWKPSFQWPVLPLTFGFNAVLLSLASVGPFKDLFGETPAFALKGE